MCALTPESVVQCSEGKIEVCSYAGEVKQTLPFSESEGEIIKIDARGKYMACVTSQSMIKIFDISRRTYKQLGITRKFEIRSGEPLGEIKEISLNSDGKKLAILADQCPFPSVRIPDSRFYVYDIDMDKFIEFQISPDRIPIEAFWDQEDPRLLAVETEFAKASTQDDVVKDIEEDDSKHKKKDDFEGKTVETFFVTTDYGIKKQDSVKFEEGEETLLGLHVPYFYYMGRKVEETEDDDLEETQ